MKARELIKLGAERLSQAGINQSDRESWLLLALASNLELSSLIARSDSDIYTDTEHHFDNLIKRRMSGEPFAYLSGKKEFYGLELISDKRALIPRPETEAIVDYVLNSKENFSVIIDIGCGSGAIAIALAKHRRAPMIYALDISLDALSLASENARLNNVTDRIIFLYSDLLSALLPKLDSFSDESIIICANLPYLRDDEKSLFPDLKFEPDLALFSGSDGLFHYRELWKQISESKFIKNNQVQLLIEISPEQTPLATKMGRISRDPIVIKDLSQRPRLILYT